MASGVVGPHNCCGDATHRLRPIVDILFLLVPLSIVLVFVILGVFAWALRSGQLDDIEREGERILRDDPVEVDADQSRR